MTNNNPHSSLNKDELFKFSAMADQWWDVEGKFKPLHRFNPVRVQYIRDFVCSFFKRDVHQSNVLRGIKILDIGCGGGLLSEPLARLGADVTGIDPLEKNIHIASIHRDQMGLQIDYRATTIEDIVEKGESYDIVLAMEVVEHVNNPFDFITLCSKAVKKDGFILVATLNRTVKSFIMAKVGAEYILRWLPVGTHDWHKFLRPSEVVAPLQQQGLKIEEIKGVSLDLISNQWRLSDDPSVNYMVLARK